MGKEGCITYVPHKGALDRLQQVHSFLPEKTREVTMCKQQHQRHREVQRAEGMLPFLVAKSGWEEIPQHRDASRCYLTAVEVSEAAALPVGTPLSCSPAPFQGYCLLFWLSPAPVTQINLPWKQQGPSIACRHLKHQLLLPGVKAECFNSKQPSPFRAVS